MPNAVLPPSTQAGSVAAAVIEPQVPPGWPGTYAPNFSDWLVGDLVLVHSAGDIPGKMIQAYQAVSACPLTRAGRMCTHIGIYVGNGMVVDTTPGVGVTERSVWSYCQTRALQLRRLEDSTIGANQIADIAVKARARLGEPYSIVQAVVSTLFPGAQPPPDALYCSTFVGLVVAQATGFLLYGEAAYQPLQPGTLAAHPELIDVPLEWRQL